MTNPPGENETVIVGAPAALLRQAADHFNNQSYKAAAAISKHLVEAEPDIAEAWYILGLVAIETRDFANAAVNIARAVSLEPENIAMRQSLAQALELNGQAEQAILAWRIYGQLAPEDPSAPFHLAGLSAESGDLKAAVELYDLSAQLAPDDPAPLVAMGRQLLSAQHHTSAVAAFRRAVIIDETRFDSWFNLASALHGLGDLDDAVKAFEAALAIDSENPDCHDAYSVALRDTGDIAGAVRHSERAVGLRPNSSEFRNNLGVAFIELGRTNEAVTALEAASALNPKGAEILNNLGIAYMGIGDLDKSVIHLQSALVLRNDWADVHHNLGNALRRMNRLEDATPHFQRALKLDPDNYKIHGSYALALLTMNRPEDAIAAYQQALDLAPDEPELHKGLGIAQLMTGDMAQGWRNYEWRWRCAGFTERNFNSSRWRGQRIENATLLIHAEQGFGDSLQFCRYIPLARKLSGAKRVIVEVQRPLLRLLRCLVDDTCDIIARRDPIPAVDFDIPMLSLPGLFDTTLDAVPADTPYLKNSEALERAWKKRVNAAAASPDIHKIGFVWSGNPNRQDDALRSCPIEEFARLWNVPDRAVYSLQVDAAPDALTQFPHVVDFSREISDFADTAALIQSMDLIITVDTAVGHLAGALGQPVWVLLGHAADWRYLQARADSPWYPTMRLFRQPTPGNWSAVIDDVRAALRDR
jgi:tetratricopeptide (TPR) repeat protein